jgi:hypothetical protein
MFSASSPDIAIASSMVDAEDHGGQDAGAGQTGPVPFAARRWA